MNIQHKNTDKLLNFYFFYQTFHIAAKNIDTLHILTSLRNNNVGIALSRFNKLLVHGLEHFQIAVYHHRDRTSAIDSIALNISDQPLVGISIHKNL